MDAQFVWDTWRRILKDDQLVELVLHSTESPAEGTTGLTSREIAILADYASTLAATDTNIGMYRRGLVRNALGALSLVPLTRHLLYATGLDVEEVATDFVQSIGYRDDGPNFWRIVGGFTQHMARLPEFAARLQQDVLALEGAAVALARRLGESAPEVWPESAASILFEAGRTVDDATRYVASRAAVAASSSFDLTEWLENPEDFDADAVLEPSKRDWLIYFPAADAAPAYAEVSERATRVFSVLSTPKTAREVSMELDGMPYSEVLEVIVSLAGLGVVAGGRVPSFETENSTLGECDIVLGPRGTLHAIPPESPPL